MKIKLLQNHVSLSDERIALIEEKVTHLAHKADRAEDESAEIKVEIEHIESRSDSDQYICKLTFFVPGNTLRAEANSDNLMSSVDDAIAKMYRQIEHYKDKTHHISERSK